MADAAATGVIPAEIETISKLKKELRRAVETLVEEDGDSCDLVAADTAIQTLRALKDLKLKQTDKEYVKLGNLDLQELPPEFKCPLSGILMTDPVVVASGETYEERCIRQWLEDGHNSCPRTDQVLSHTTLIPNHSVKRMIMNWCKQHSVDMPRTSLPDEDDQFPANVDKEYLVHMLDKLSSSSISDQIKITKELRLLTNRLPSCRALFGEITSAFHKLFSQQLLDSVHSNTDLHEHFLAMILNISADETNRDKIIPECPQAVFFLIQSLRGRNIEIRSLAAAALYALSTVDENKQFLCDLGAVGSLIGIIEEMNLMALKDAALALHNLCTVISIRERAISEGAVSAVVDKIKARILRDEMMELLARLSLHHQTIEMLESLGMIQCLFDLLKESMTSEQNKEHCVAIIHAMCFSNRAVLKKVDRVENGYEVLKEVTSTGTSRAQRKATDILKRLKSIVFFSHTA